MGDIPLWPFFLPSDHPNKRDLEMLPTMEARQAHAVNIIIPLIKQHLSSIRTNTSNGLRKYASLHTYVDSWLKKWAPQVDVKEFWKSISKGYQAPSYAPGGPGASPYPPGPPLTLRTEPYQKPSYVGPMVPDALVAAHSAPIVTNGVGLVAGAALEGTGTALHGIASAAATVGDCLPSGDCLPGGDCCTVVGGRRKNKRKTLRRRRCKKRTRKTRRV